MDHPLPLPDPCPRSAVFGLPPGADFPAALAAGLILRHGDGPPERFARVEVFVNSRLMQTRLRLALSAQGARLLPRIRLVSDLGAQLPAAGVPTSALRRRLELMRLVSGLLQSAPDMAPRAAAWSLTESLAELLEEMQAEAVPFAALERVNTADLAEHWERRLTFLRIIAPLLEPGSAGDPSARQARAVAAQIRRWQDLPPAHPVVIAGSTGSRATTFEFMRAVAGLEAGAVVLPGVDRHMPPEAWQAVAEGSEDHPQFRAATLCTAIGLEPDRIGDWVTGSVPPRIAARNRLVSLALRPPPVTDRWLDEGPSLAPFEAATEGLSLLEAADPREEALAIALILRNAAAAQRRAVLVTPDRMLARRVTAALDRWGIVPDDSAGRPLGLSPPGRLLRQVVRMAGRVVSPQDLVALIRHPLVHTGAERGAHLLHTRDLDLALRRRGPGLSDPGALARWAAEREAAEWGRWLAETATMIADWGEGPLAAQIDRHITIAERLARGCAADAGSGGLWEAAAGVQAQDLAAELRRDADAGGEMSVTDYAALFDGLIAGRAVRDAAAADPRIAIRGPVEARAIAADLWVLGGLNDGIWPGLPEADPWLNRRMRAEAGLLSPERRIGLAAHDVQMALAGAEVVLTRARRDGESETVPSRWLSRLLALLDGVRPAGPEALDQMRARAAGWLTAARGLDRPERRETPAPRPAPAPPVQVRPTELPVTAITTLIRDPYAIYARHVLRLRRLHPLVQDADARLRGEVLHQVMERVVKAEPPVTEPAQLLALTDTVLAERVPWPAARLLWRGRFAAIAEAFLADEAERDSVPLLAEQQGRAPVGSTGVVLTARPDRIDREADGRLRIIDYKTGDLPSAQMIAHFEKQMPLEVALASRDGFGLGGGHDVAGYRLVRIGASYLARDGAMTAEGAAQVWAELERLIATYMQPQQGYAAARAPRSERHSGDYDHLARRGEWDRHDQPVTIPVGRTSGRGAT